jgi:hypothetical protein
MADREHAIRQPQFTRIAPGRYTAACIRASHYFDKALRRWVCFLLWSAFTPERTKIPQWFNLGAKEKPYAPLRSTYLKEWVRANGGPPQRGDRLSPRVFRGRIAQVEIADTEKSAISYSVVRKILTWQVAPSAVKQSSNEAMKDGMGEVPQKTELTPNARQILGVPKPSEAKGGGEIPRKWDGSFGNCESAGSISCAKHPGTGLTDWGTCYGCYRESARRRKHMQ